LQRLDAILTFVAKGIEGAARLEASARPLQDDDVSPARPKSADGIGGDVVAERLAERNADHDRGVRAALLRPIDVGDEGYAVRRRHRDVTFDFDGVLCWTDAFTRQDAIGNEYVTSAEAESHEQNREPQKNVASTPLPKFVIHRGNL